MNIQEKNILNSINGKLNNYMMYQQNMSRPVITIYSKGKPTLFCGLNSQSFSVKEFIHLQGGDIKEEFRNTFSKKTYSDLEKLFWDFSDKIKSGNYEYISWNKVIKIFTRDSREAAGKKDSKNKVQIDKNKVLLSPKNQGVVYICDTLILQEKYLENAVDDFLAELYDYRLIGKYEASLENRNIRIRFITYHKEICEIISNRIMIYYKKC